MKILKAIVNVMGSFWLASILLVLVLVLVLASTFEQGRSTLFDVIERYYESFFVVHYWGGRYPTPLPGGYLLFPLLFLNLLVGGILRMRVRTTSVGVFIVHLGIVGLFVGGFVEAKTATRGSMQVWEPRPQEDRLHVEEAFRSPQAWEVVVSRQEEEGGSTDFLIPQAAFEDMGRRGRVRAVSSSLPFDVVLSGYLRNAVPKSLPRERRSEGVEGYVLEQRAPVTAEEERKSVNVPGVYATLEERKTGKAHRALLWGKRTRPFRLVLGDQVWSLQLRRRTWQLPFRVGLDRFVHEFHPGTGMPRRFSSYVTITEDRGGAPVDREVHITMNEPLRYDDYTLYQSGWGPQDPSERRSDGRMYSVFSVVHNPTDHFLLGIAWSVWAWIVIAVGLLLHYILKLVNHLVDERVERAALAGSSR